MKPFTGVSVMVGPTELLGKALGRPSPVECPERKRPLSSPVACVASGLLCARLCPSAPPRGLVCSGRQGAHSAPRVAPGVSGLGGLAEFQKAQWPVGFQKLPQAPVGVRGTDFLLAAENYTDFTGPSCSINQKAASSWWDGV